MPAVLAETSGLHQDKNSRVGTSNNQANMAIGYFCQNFQLSLTVLACPAVLLVVVAAV
jgi:hypothetical protein